MPLHAKEFFAELALPFPSGTVVADTYYATPSPDSPLRLRIEFARTIRLGEYDGLRLTVIHPDRGTLDTQILRFADHHTFARRDTARGINAGHDGYAVFRDWGHGSPPPWSGAELTAMRQAVENFAEVWFPGPRRAEKIEDLSQVMGAASEGFWATDPGILTALHVATDQVLDLVEDGTYDGIPVTQALHNARYYVRDALGLPLDCGLLAEAAAVTHLTVRRLGPPTAEALARIDAMSPDDQRTLVQAAVRRHATTHATPTARPTPPPPAIPAPATGTSARSR